MANVFVQGIGRGIKFRPSMANQPGALRAALLNGEVVEVDEGILGGLYTGTYKIIKKAQSSDSPPVRLELEPDDEPEVHQSQASESKTGTPSEGSKESGTRPKSKVKKDTKSD